jgi:putative chitinase
MTDWAAVIKKMAPKAVPSVIKGLSEAMPRCIEIANLNTPLRQAHFLSQLAHESAGFRTTTEFASGKAYEGRKDLGNTQPGDGVRFKGRGLIQVTGRQNYAQMGKLLGQDFVADPKLAAAFPWAALTAAEYWKSRNINRAADKDDVRTVTRLINGGFNGLDDRIKYLAKAKDALKRPPPAQTTTIDIAAAQRRLAELSYPPGAADGKIGPLTRSAIRDFQDASGFPVTGALDKATYMKLMSDDAPRRPVSEERAAITKDDLKNAGSKIIESTESIKNTATTAAGALASAAGVVTQAKDSAEHVQTVSEWLPFDWRWLAAAVLFAVVAFCIWRIWKFTSVVEDERVHAARTGENVRI